jgi:hypothetical protein
VVALALCVMLKEEALMKRRSSENSWHALTSVTEAAERFVNRTPRLKRLEAERQALLDAIRQAQLVLSVRRWPETSVERPRQRARS